MGGDVFGDIEARILVGDKIWKSLELKKSMLRMKSGQNWLKEGNLNTKYFHNSLKEKVRRNYLCIVAMPSRLVEGVKEVKLHIKDHFEKFFKEPCRLRPVPGGVVFRRLELADSVNLEHPFMHEEIKAAIWNCDGSKTPGPDGFSLLFCTQKKELLNDDILKFVEDF